MRSHDVKMSTAKVAAITFFVVLAVLLAGCAKIPTGSVGIAESFTGRIARHAVPQGLYVSVLTSYYPIDTTITRADVENLQPKDAHGVRLRDVSVVVSYYLNPALVAKFYRHTKERDREKDSDLYTLGYDILTKSVIPYAVQLATEQSSLDSVSSHLTQFASTIQRISTKRLNDLYPGINPFIIQSVTIQNFQLPVSIQKQMNAKAGYKAEMQTIRATCGSLPPSRAS